MRKMPRPTQQPPQRAFLVGAELPGEVGSLPVEDSLSELALLAETAGLAVVGRLSQKLRRIDPKTFLGSGKIEEVKALAEEQAADIILFDDELSPRHQRELEEILPQDFRILDRTALILDIFAQPASTREGSLQVELAQYQYRLPRLTRAWTHLARQAGGGGGRSGSTGGVGLRGPGETQLEVDRRMIGRRISQLKDELEKVRQHRRRHRARRKKAEIHTVALVGYTNAGKSTLLNRLSGAEVYVADQLFATLDPTTRRVELPSGQEMLLTDTVGFIQKLPTMLVAAFRATLEEITEAEMLLHVVDVTHPNMLAQAEAVRDTLEEIDGLGVPRITALNKIDLMPDPGEAVDVVDEFERAIPVSAKTGEGVDQLLDILEHELLDQLLQIVVRLPYDHGRLISLFHEHGIVDLINQGEESVLIKGRIPVQFKDEFSAFIEAS